MSAFNDVIAAEGEAAEAISQAKEEVVTMLAATRTAVKAKLAAEEEALKTAQTEAVQTKEQAVARTVTQIETEADAAVVSLRQRFSSKQAELEEVLLRRFQ